MFNKVTTLSKILALVLFIALPFIGFYLGIQYQKSISFVSLIPSQNTPNSLLAPQDISSSNTPDYCDIDSDCGINICDCLSLRKEFIKPEDQICTRVCSGLPRCANNRCILDPIEGKTCGGNAAFDNRCPTGYKCVVNTPKGSYDFPGKCVKE